VSLHYLVAVHVCSEENILFGISVVTFEVSSCTRFQIFWSSTPDLAGELAGLVFESWKTRNSVFASPEKSWETSV